MTREEILAMEPGDDIDRLIDECIYDRKPERFPSGWRYYDGAGWRVTRDYSSDISTAWEVVKQLREEYGLRLHLELQNHSGCYIWLENDIGGNVTGCYEFESEIEGICKIALLAVMNKEDTHDKEL